MIETKEGAAKFVKFTENILLALSILVGVALGAFMLYALVMSLIHDTRETLGLTAILATAVLGAVWYETYWNAKEKLKEDEGDEGDLGAGVERDTDHPHEAVRVQVDG